MLVEQESEVAALLPLIKEGRWVVKPLNSASTDGVMFADGSEGVSQALAQCAWNEVNDLGEVNRGFVIQPFVEGKEYVVDLVAHTGGITVASVCSYRKEPRNGSRFVYVGLDVLDPDAPQYRALTDYALKAARVLGLRVGPMHMELFDSVNGPVMIEAGARLHGGVAPELFRDCYAPHLLDLSVDAYLGNEILNRKSMQLQHGHIVFLANDEPGEFTGPNDEFLARLRKMRSYRGHRLFVQRGEWMPRTIDLATCPGIVWLADHSGQRIELEALACREARLQ